MTLIGETMEKRQAEAERARRIAREKNISAAAGINRPEIEPLLRAARNRINSGKQLAVLARYARPPLTSRARRDHSKQGVPV